MFNDTPARKPGRLLGVRDVTKVVVCGTLSGMVHIKDPLLLIGKSSPSSGGSRFLVSLLKWSFLIFTTPYNRKLKKYVVCVVK